MRKSLVCLGLLFATPVFAQSEGEALMNKLCVACHIVQGKPAVAPPMFGVVNHVKQVHTERDAFVEHIVTWVKEPNAETALMPGAVRKFGLMPKQDFAEADVRKIAEYLYGVKFDLPEWYIKHYTKKHGQPPKQ